MTQSSDDELLLNIRTNNVQRIQKEKQKKRNSFPINGEPPKKRLKTTTSAQNDVNEFGFEIDRGNRDKYENKGSVFSSLFRNNPDIPVVVQRNIKAIKEKVFSNKVFKHIEIHPFTVSNLEQNFNITKTTKVQELSIPVLLSGKDALIRSQTGSGKTLAYAIPIIESLQKVRPKISRSDGVKALIIIPTRELALQTYECFVKLVKSFTWLVPCLLVGGEKRKSEKARLRKGVTILICTPGRLLDHITHTQALQLNGVQWLILDEADRLLDLGYEKDVASINCASIIKCLESPSNESEENVTNEETVTEPVHRQTVLLSATLTPKVEELAGLTLNNPTRIDASSKNASSETDIDHVVIPKSLKQQYVITPPKLRLVTLAGIIHWKCPVEKGGSKMLIFMATQDMVDYFIELFSVVLKDCAKYFKLHGSMTQYERTEIFKTFREANAGVLLCTDVAARGLDLPRVDWIVQFTAPTTVSDYVHRVGRTARVGLKGSAILFLVPSEVPFLNWLEEKSFILESEAVDNCIKNLRLLEMERAEKIEKSKRGGPTVEAAATALQLEFEDAVSEQKKLHELGAKAYTSWVRFYSSYPKQYREVFNFKNLHRGHFAKSFALRDPPKTIGGIGKPNFKKQDKKSIKHQKTPANIGNRQGKLFSSFSEFDSGLKEKKKKKKL